MLPGSQNKRTPPAFRCRNVVFLSWLTTAGHHIYADRKLLHARTLNYYVHCKKSPYGYWLFLFGLIFVKKTNFVFLTKIEPNGLSQSLVFGHFVHLCKKVTKMVWISLFKLVFSGKGLRHIFLSFWTIHNLWDFPNPQHSTWNPLTHLDHQILPKSCIDIKNLPFTIFTLSAFGSMVVWQQVKESQK